VKEMRRLWPHLLLLAVAATAAFVESRPEKERRPLLPGEVELWGGEPEDLTKVVYQTKRQTVVLRSREDDHGRWYEGRIEPAAEDEADAGTEADAGKPRRPKVEPSVFVSVQKAESLAEQLGSLRAKRAVGEVSAERLKAFGLDEPEERLRVELGKEVHVLLMGSTTPGRADRYARDEESGAVYVIDNRMAQDLAGGEHRLKETQVHGWLMSEVKSLRIGAGQGAGQKERKLVRGGTEGRQFWADAARPEDNDETAANWLKKLERLRPRKYIESLPEQARQVVRVEFVGEKDALGFVELYRHSGEGDKPDYYLSSERLRLPASVQRTLAEQVEQDLESILQAAAGAEPAPSAAASTAAAPEATASP